MKIRIKFNSDLLDFLILALMYLSLTLLDFFGLARILNFVMLSLCLIRIITFKKNDIKQIFLSVFLIILFLLSCAFGRSLSKTNLHSNGLMLAYSYIYIYIYYVYLLCHNKTKFIDKVMDKCFWIFNLTLLINFVVLYMQINFPYSIIATTTANEIDFYLDLCSGLFTYGGTHVLNLFTCFIAVYNFAFASKLKNLNRKHALIIYNIIIIGISLFISTFNDNKAMFILLPVIIAIYFYSCKKTQSARIDRILKTIITIPLLIILLYQVFPEIKSFIDDNFLSLNTMINESVNIGNEANGSNERIAMIKYALDDVETYLFGKGFATVGLYTEGFEGFNHFGQADFGTLLNLGGIWFVIVLFYSYYRMIMKIVDKKNKNVIASVGIFCFLMFVFAYTQAFTAKDLCLALILIALAFKCEFNYSITTNRKHVNNLSAYRRCHC